MIIIIIMIQSGAFTSKDLRLSLSLSLSLILQLFSIAISNYHQYKQQQLQSHLHRLFDLLLCICGVLVGRCPIALYISSRFYQKSEVEQHTHLQGAIISNNNSSSAASLNNNGQCPSILPHLHINWVEFDPLVD